MGWADIATIRMKQLKPNDDPTLVEFEDGTIYSWEKHRSIVKNACERSRGILHELLGGFDHNLVDRNDKILYQDQLSNASSFYGLSTLPEAMRQSLRKLSSFVRIIDILCKSKSIFLRVEFSGARLQIISLKDAKQSNEKIVMAWLLSRRECHADYDHARRQLIEDAIELIELGFDTSDRLRRSLEQFRAHRVLNGVEDTRFLELADDLNLLLVYLFQMTIGGGLRKTHGAAIRLFN